MKYTSILAGAFGLMALAACTNNDEVAMEQPKVAQTITVTYGNGADTRFTLSDFSETEGIKSSWDKNDEISFNAKGLENPISFIADEGGQTATFRLVGGVELEDGKLYRACYPPVLLTKGFDLSKQTGLKEDLIDVDAVAAYGSMEYNKNAQNAVTLKPVCSFIRIPAGTIFDSLNEIPADFSSAYFEFQGSGLFPVFDPNMEEGEMYEGKIVIDPAENKLLGLMDKEIKATTDIYIALPLTDGSITSLSALPIRPLTGRGSRS